MSKLLPEWAPQWGVMLAWPHTSTDWHSLLPEAEHCYQNIARAICTQSNLLVLCKDTAHQQHIASLLQDIDPTRVLFRHVHYNDTWARDFGPLTVLDGHSPTLLDFQFNGWGSKFDAAEDNRVNRNLATQQLWKVPLIEQAIVLEGGSIETNGRDTLLTTSHCLLNPNRNPHLTKNKLEQALCTLFGVSRIWWLDHGYMAGDDTDSHIDTLARFCDEHTVCYVQSTDPEDEHHQALTRMELQLKAYQQHTPSLQLIPLPMTPAIYDDDGQRLPATYANFLILNEAVLAPVYNQPTDQLALSQLQRCFPSHTILPVDCNALIKQHGSLHCVTMQLPEGVI